MRREPVAAWLVIACLAAGVGGLLVVSHSSAFDYGRLAAASFVVAISSLTITFEAWGRDYLSGPFAYQVLFVPFHFGLIWTMGIVGEGGATSIDPYALFWIRTDLLTAAVYLSCLGCLVYSVTCLGAALVMRRGGRKAPVRHSSNWAGTVGLAVEAVGFALMVRTFFAIGGFSALSGGYGRFLESAQTSATGYALWMIGVGAAFSQFGSARQRRAGVALFAVFGVVFFLVGLRGSILFPATVIVLARARVGLPLRLRYLAIGTFVVLFASSVVRLTRLGVSGAQQDWLAGALSTMTELGFSIRPSVEVLKWESLGAEKTHFVSVFAAPIRAWETVTGWHGGPPAVDYRLFNVKVSELVGAIGGSPIAEGYDAAGTVGVIVTMGVLAVVISRCFAPSSSLFGALATPVIFLPIVISVRNSFAPVLVQIALGLMLAWVASRSSVPVMTAEGEPSPSTLRSRRRGRRELGADVTGSVRRNRNNVAHET